jgi:hypothetical protein
VVPPVPVPQVRVQGWPRKALLALGVVLIIAIGSTLVPRSHKADPVLASVYLSQITPTVNSVQLFVPGLRARAEPNPTGDLQALAVMTETFRVCRTTLKGMGVPEGLGGAHRELLDACDGYGEAVLRAQKWQTGKNPGDLVRLRVLLGRSDKQWQKGLTAVSAASGRAVPTAPGSGGSDGTGGSDSPGTDGTPGFPPGGGTL